MLVKREFHSSVVVYYIYLFLLLTLVHDVLNNAMDKIGLAYSGLHCPKRPTSLDAPAIVAMFVVFDLFCFLT